MKSLMRLAGKAASLSNKVVQHIDTANKVLATVQSVADQHLQGTNLHKTLTKTVGMAQGQLSAAHGVATHLRNTPEVLAASIKHGGGNKRKSRKRTRIGKKRKSVKRTKSKRRKSRH
jgi:hypothetical protein